MLNQIISWLLLQIPGIVYCIALEQMLEGNSKRGSRRLRIEIMMLIWGAGDAMQIWCNDNNLFLYMKNLLYLPAWMLYIYLMYKGPFWKKVAAHFALFFATSSAEFTYFVVDGHMDMEKMRLLDYRMPEWIAALAIGDVFAIVLIVLILYIWKWICRKANVLKSSGFFLIYIMRQCFSLVLLEDYIWTSETKYKVLLVYAFSLICDIVLLIILFEQAEKETMQKELVETKYKAELERNHYQEITRKREEIARISGENQKVLEEIRKLLKEDKIKEAQKELGGLLHRVQSTGETPYCPIPIVNVILAEKQKICDTKGIRFETDIQMPEETGISQMDLCCAYGNLLDNAVHACEKAKTEGQETWIHLITGMIGNYLVIKCENFAAKKPGEVPDGTGYGIKILKDIAKRYEGDFRTNDQKQQFQAQLTIRFR